MKTAPPSVARQRRVAKRSSPRPPSRRQASSWCAPSTLMPTLGARRSRGQVVELCAVQTETTGGSSETDVNELAAMPSGLPSASPATAVTPVGNAPNTRRSSAWPGTADEDEDGDDGAGDSVRSA